MPIYYETASGPQPIPEAIISDGPAATEAFIAAQGWAPPAPPPAAEAAPDAPAPDPTADQEG